MRLDTFGVTCEQRCGSLVLGDPNGSTDIAADDARRDAVSESVAANRCADGRP